VNVETPPSCVVLWEPVIDGPDYLKRLMTAHRDDLSREMHRSWQELLRRGEREPTVPGSLLGFTLGPKVHRELQQPHELPLRTIVNRGTRIVMALQDDAHGGGSSYDIPGVTLHRVETVTNWMSTEAGGSAIVPQEIPRALLATL
jgi:hypothetical protein